MLKTAAWLSKLCKSSHHYRKAEQERKPFSIILLHLPPSLPHWSTFFGPLQLWENHASKKTRKAETLQECFLKKIKWLLKLMLKEQSLRWCQVRWFSLVMGPLSMTVKGVHTKLLGKHGLTYPAEGWTTTDRGLSKFLIISRLDLSTSLMTVTLLWEVSVQYRFFEIQSKDKLSTFSTLLAVRISLPVSGDIDMA
jgi:hypothetical protein